MKAWKIILAAFVIFVAGAVTGAIIYTQFIHKKESASRPPGSPNIPRPDFAKWLGNKLQLTKEQEEKIEQILLDSHERLKPLRELIDPLMQDEVKRVKEEILKVLTPEQQQKYEDLFKWRPPRRPEGRPQTEGGPPGGGKPPEMRIPDEKFGQGPERDKPPFQGRGDNRDRRFGPPPPRPGQPPDFKNNDSINVRTNPAQEKQ
ncbi:MAG: hypothetical protein N2487_00785 [Verrucomicrobiae bacterium]|nr:hypothetical protein [Verrucomicrobiae bacterium]